MLDYSTVFQDKTLQESEEWLLEHCHELLAIKLDRLPSKEARVGQTENLTESFLLLYGVHCNQRILTLLSDYLLLDFIKHPLKNKSQQDNSFHSHSQQKARKRAEIPLHAETMDHFNLRNSWNIAFKVNTKEQQEE